MNLKDEIFIWPKRFKKIPHPIYVVRADEHCIVCELDEKYNLVNELTNIHWNKFIARRWALDIAKERGLMNG
jgi:hypothetical protein